MQWLLAQVTQKLFDDTAAWTSSKLNESITQIPTENHMWKITSVHQTRAEFQMILREQRITGGQLQVELTDPAILEETDPLKNPINHVPKNY